MRRGGAKNLNILQTSYVHAPKEEIGEDRLTFAIDGDNGEWREGEGREKTKTPLKQELDDL